MNRWFALYPHVGGGKGTYPRIVAALRRYAHCHIPQLPGRDGRYREPPLDRFGALADDLWAQLQEPIRAGHDPGELLLFGFSMGGLLATEMATRLQQRGTLPCGLVVAGCPPPDRLNPAAGIAHLPDEQFVASLAAHGMMAESLRAEPELIALMLPIWRADCAALESHPRVPVALGCPVVAVAGADDAFVPPDALAAWRQAGGPGSAVRTVSGRHAAALTDERLVLDLLDGLTRDRPKVGAR